MVAQSDKQIKEQLTPAVEHLKLHRATALECRARANDEGEIMCSELGVVVGGIGVGVAGRCEDGATLDARFCETSCQQLSREMKDGKGMKTHEDLAFSGTLSSTRQDHIFRQHSR